MGRPCRRGVSYSSFIHLLFLSLLSSRVSAAVVDFSLYPQAAQACLFSAASTANCDSSTVPTFNACVCNNGGGFIDSAATCLGKSDASDLATVYTVLSRNCGDSNTPVSYPLAQFLAKAGQDTTATTSTKTTIVTGGVTTVSVSGSTKVSTLVSTVVTSGAEPVVSTISYTATNSAGQPTTIATTLTLAGASASASPSQSSAAVGSGGGSKGLSTGAIAGIAVGVGVPVVLALVGIIAVLVWKTKKDHKKRESEAYVASPPGPPSARPVSSVTTLPVDNTYPQQPLYAGNQQYKPPQASYSPDPQLTQPAYGHPGYNHSQYGGYSPNQQYQGMAPGVVEVAGTPVARPHELPGYQ